MSAARGGLEKRRTRRTSAGNEEASFGEEGQQVSGSARRGGWLIRPVWQASTAHGRVQLMSVQTSSCDGVVMTTWQPCVVE